MRRRTRHPDTPAAGRLRELRKALLRLHKVLVDVERAAYERAHGRVASPGEMFRMLIEHPWFAWLRPLSALIVRIDEALAGEEPLGEEEGRALVLETRALLGASEGAPGLGERYWAAIQNDPGVALAHGAVVARLGPPPA